MAIGTGAALLGAGLGSALIGGSSSRRAASQVAASSDAATAEQRRQFDIATGLMRPSIDAGNASRAQLMQLLGLGGGAAGAGSSALGTRVGPGGFPRLDILSGYGGRTGFGPMARGAFDKMTPNFTAGGTGVAAAGGTASADPLDVIRNTPGYEFQLEQGRRAINANRSAGGTSGGELMKDFARFNQGVASNFYQDYANRLANLAGTGQTAAANQGNLGMMFGQQVGNNLMNAGTARASGILGQGNAFGGFLEQIAGAIGSGVPFNGWPFGGGSGSGGGGIFGSRT